MTNKLSKALKLTAVFIIGYMVILLVSSLSAHADNIATVFAEGQTVLEQVLSGIKNALRIFCTISFFVLIWKYLKDQVQWDQLLKYAGGILLMGLSNEIILGLLGPAFIN